MVDDIGVDVVKIGMLGMFDFVDMVWCLFEILLCGVLVVFDLVMVVISGDVLSVVGMVWVMVELLLLVVFVIFNLFELEVFGGEVVIFVCVFVLLIKGGYVVGDMIVDCLFIGVGEVVCWEDMCIMIISIYGIGCMLVSGIVIGFV